MAMQLIDCPGGDAASEIRNSNDCLPADIAELEGFPELAQMLRGYMVSTLPLARDFHQTKFSFSFLFFRK